MHQLFRFDELCGIRYGRESLGLEAVCLAVCRLIGKVHDGYRQILERKEACNAASLSLVLKDGRVFTFRPGSHSTASPRISSTSWAFCGTVILTCPKVAPTQTRWAHRLNSAGSRRTAGPGRCREVVRVI